MLVADHVVLLLEVWGNVEPTSHTKPLNPACPPCPSRGEAETASLRIPEQLRGGVCESDGDGMNMCGTSVRITMSHEKLSIPSAHADAAPSCSRESFGETGLGSLGSRDL